MSTNTETKQTKNTSRRRNGAASKEKPSDKVQELRERLKAAVKERDTEVDAVLSAVLAEEHVVLLGPPGTAKSMLTRLLCNAITGARYFEWMMTRYTEPNELFGPTDLKKWTDTGDYGRVMTGKLPEADIVFLDEIYKANSAILNALLPVINERVFHDGAAGSHRVPLRSVIGASNELPESGGELEALHDRFLVRLVVDYVAEEESFNSILFGEEPSVDPILTFDMLDAAIAEAQALPVSKEVGRALFELREKLNQEGIVVSDRRWRKLVKLLRSYAYLNGDSMVETIHFEILVHGMWRDPRERSKVQGIVTKVASPALSEATEVFDAIMEQVNGLPAQDVRSNGGPTVAAEVKKAMKRLEEKRGDAGPAVSERIGAMIGRLQDAHTGITEKVMAEMGMD